jgi:uncharacterized OB-fold protein
MAVTVDAARCRDCGTLTYPTHYYCPSCGGRRFEPVAISGEGTILTWTRVHALPLDYEQRFITLAIVELDMGIRATGRLEMDEPAIGARVRATTGTVREIGNREVAGLIFVPA